MATYDKLKKETVDLRLYTTVLQKAGKPIFVVDPDDKNEKRLKQVEESAISVKEEMDALLGLQKIVNNSTTFSRPICLAPFLWSQHFQLIIARFDTAEVQIYDNEGGKYAKDVLTTHAEALRWALLVLITKTYKVELEKLPFDKKRDSGTECGPFVCLHASILLFGDEDIITKLTAKDAHAFREVVRNIVTWSAARQKTRDAQLTKANQLIEILADEDDGSKKAKKPKIDDDDLLCDEDL